MWPVLIIISSYIENKTVTAYVFNLQYFIFLIAEEM